MRRYVGAGAVLVVLWCGSGATAQTTAVLAQEEVALAIDSGLVGNPTPRRAVIFAREISVPDSTWLRLVFDEVALGRGADGGRTLLRVTSLRDGATQNHTAATLAQWQNSSAYFNGDAVLLELVAPARAAASRVRMSRVLAGPPAAGVPASICGPTDDRLPSNDARAARALPIGCTAWLINDSRNCFLTAGHCSTTSLQTIQFNVPESDASGNIQHPGPEDQYAVDVGSKQSVNGGIGNDWGYFGCHPNTETGLTAGEAQGAFYTLAATPPPVSGQNIRITGYGVDSSPPEWNQTQQTHAGPYATFAGTTLQYQTDTTGGNSGSAVVDDSTGLAVGIHTHAGCDAGGGANNGTGINQSGIQNALANPQGVCLPLPPLAFDYPDGLPELLDPAGDTVRVVVSGANGGAPESGTGELHYDLGAGPVTVAMVEVSPNEYDAVFPAIECGTTVAWYVSAASTMGELVNDPLLAPSQTHSALSAVAVNVVFNDDFEHDFGWVVSNDPGLTTGQWERGVPLGGGDRGDPPTDADGSGQCYVTGRADGDNDIDGGSTTLTSPILDASDPNALLSYYRWYSNTFGADPMNDVFIVDISGDGGATWLNLETVGPGGSEVNGGWYLKEWLVADTPAGSTSQLRVRFTAGDLNAGSVVEGGVDGVGISIVECGAEGCPWDLDGDNSVSTSDLLALLSAWGPNPGHPADFNGDGVVGTSDLLELLANWGGCG